MRRVGVNKHDLDVLFMVVPFAVPSRPSLGVSTLSALLSRRGFRCETYYSNFDFLERIGADTYDMVNRFFISMVGEWMFSHLLPGYLPESDEGFKRTLLAVRPFARTVIDRVLELRHHCEPFVESVAQEAISRKTAVVAFSVMHLQTVPALLIARRIKELSSDIQIVFGGASCEGEMGAEMLRSFPWVDFVCTGEGDEVFPEWVNRICTGQWSFDVPGMLGRGSAYSTPPMVENLEDHPIPEFDSFFASLGRYSARDRVRPILQMEASRGCWKAQRELCTFCGLNGSNLVYRSKSGARVKRELVALAERYGIRQFFFTDTILKRSYANSVFAELSAEGRSIDVFFEAKPPISYDDLVKFRKAGVTAFQPGIEHLSDEVLRVMKKGHKAVDNLRLMRHCVEVGIRPEWFFIYGFGNESPSACDEVATLIPWITHLPPPEDAKPLRMDRFSEHFQHPERYGFCNLRPQDTYKYIYHLDDAATYNLAYYFHYEYADGKDHREWFHGLGQEVRAWIQAHRGENTPPSLVLRGDGTVLDCRPKSPVSVHHLSQRETWLLHVCDDGATRSRIEATAQRDGVVDLDLGTDIESLRTRGLVADLEGVILTLPTFESRTRTWGDEP